MIELTYDEKRKLWLEERKGGIGASDASAVMGLNPYKSNVQLWEEKTGRIISEDISDKPYVKYGNEAEEPLRVLFGLDYPQYEIIYNEFKLYRHSEYDFLFSTLDGFLIELSTQRQGVLEIKTAEILSSMHKEKWSGGKVPDNYFVQVIHQLLTTGAEFAYLKAQLKYDYEGQASLNTRHYYIERKNYLDDIEILLEKELKFWECVERDIKPDLILPPI